MRPVLIVAGIGLALLIAYTLDQPRGPDLGTLHLPDDPTKVLIVNAHRVTGDVPVTFHAGHLDYAGECAHTRFSYSRKVAASDFDFIRNAFEWEGPTLVVVTPSHRLILPRDTALQGIHEVAAIVNQAATTTGRIPRPDDSVLDPDARDEIADAVRAKQSRI